MDSFINGTLHATLPHHVAVNMPSRLHPRVLDMRSSGINVNRPWHTCSHLQGKAVPDE